MHPATWTPRHAVLAFMLAQIVLWSMVPLLANQTLPLDVIREGLAWGGEWSWGYYKHPPLTTWLVDGAFRLLGDLGPYLLSQIAVATTYGFVFLLGRRLMGERKAAIGTLLLAGIYYFSWPTPEFNHNVAQMPFWAAAAYLFHRAIREDRWRWWLALGAVAAGGLLVKYAMAVLLATMALSLSLLARQETRRVLRSPRPYAGLAVMLVVLLPHWVWLLRNDFQPLHYLQSRSAAPASFLQAHIVDPVRFLAAQFCTHLPMLAVIGLAGWFGRAQPPDNADGPAEQDRGFLVALALGPVILCMALAALGGFALRDMWGDPMFNLSGLLAVQLCAPRWPGLDLRRTAVAAAILLLGISSAYGIRSTVGIALTGTPQRVDWPDRPIARAMESAWRGATSCPLRIVAGDSWLAGLISARSDARPAVLLEGDLAISPWISRDRLVREGALLVWRIDGEQSAKPAVLAALGASGARGSFSFDWPRAPLVAPLRLGWAILPPSCGEAPRTALAPSGRKP